MTDATHRPQLTALQPAIQPYQQEHSDRHATATWAHFNVAHSVHDERQPPHQTSTITKKSYFATLMSVGRHHWTGSHKNYCRRNGWTGKLANWSHPITRLLSWSVKLPNHFLLTFRLPNESLLSSKIKKKTNLSNAINSTRDNAFKTVSQLNKLQCIFVRVWNLVAHNEGGT